MADADRKLLFMRPHVLDAARAREDYFASGSFPLNISIRDAGDNSFREAKFKQNGGMLRPASR